jgi:16S rRNA (guanine527-N7)-methyltransferase
MRDAFTAAIREHRTVFNIYLAEETIARLADYYELVQQHNPILHLVGPCTPEEFAIRHILESLTMLEFLPEGARFADVGAGAGLPSIPCLIARDDLFGQMIESKEKKTKFLTEAIGKLGIEGRAEIANRQFAEVELNNITHVCSRALDRFEDTLPRLLKWAGKRGLLLSAGNNLRAALEKHRVIFTSKLMPLSEQRYLFVIDADNRNRKLS